MTSPVPADEPCALVVDDHPVNREVLVQMLEVLGWQSVPVASGAEALARLRSGSRYTVVLMDLQMPELDGLETTRRLRAAEHEDGSPRTAVVAITAHSALEQREASREAGADGFLTKPVSLSTLREALASFGPEADASSPLLREETMNQLLRLTEGDPALSTQLLEAFEESARQHLEELAEARRAGDLERVRRVAHALSGASVVVGASRVAEGAARMERNAEKERYPRPADIEALERDFEEARLALSARLLDQG